MLIGSAVLGFGGKRSGITGTILNSGDKSANLTLDGTGLIVSAPTSAWSGVRSVAAKSTGKHYCECHFSVNNYGVFGIVSDAASLDADPHDFSTGYTMRNVGDGNWYKSNNSSSTSLFGSAAANDVIGVAYDADAAKVWFSRNGTFSGDPVAGTGEAYSSIATPKYICVYLYSGASSQVATCRFGTSALTYAAPTGFAAGWAA